MNWVCDKDRVRLDLYLSTVSGKSRSFVKSTLKSERVKLNGVVVTRPSQLLKVGDVVECEFVENLQSSVEPVEAKLDILFEDKDVLVLNKQQGWVVHPAKTFSAPTVVHYLLHYFQGIDGFSSLDGIRPGIVHRLDRGTSGCLVIAKNRPALEFLCKQFKDRKVIKVYEAFVWGKPKPTFQSVAPIGRHRSDRKRMSTKTMKGRSAETVFETLKTIGPMSLVRCYPKTGRTHQIRVHLATLGHAIVGDSVYGKKRSLSHLPVEVADWLKNNANETFLHAKGLKFSLPSTCTEISVVAENPSKFVELMEILNRNFTSGV